MDRSEFLNHNIYVPDVWNEAIIAYLNLGYYILVKVGNNPFFIVLKTTNNSPYSPLSSYYDLHLLNDDDIKKITWNVSFIYKEKYISFMYISNTQKLLQRINHNMYE